MLPSPLQLIDRLINRLFNQSPINKLTVCQLGNPALRAIAAAVTDVHDPQIQQLIDEMILTLKESRGVGLAAPQVGRSLQLIVIASHPNERYPQAPQMEPFAMINPQIISHSDVKMKDWEGCLSVPMIRGLVPRYQEIEVSYSDRAGNLQQTKLTDFVARIFQHEYDHLEGKVFLDRVETSLDLITEAEYHKL